MVKFSKLFHNCYNNIWYAKKRETKKMMAGISIKEWTGMMKRKFKEGLCTMLIVLMGLTGCTSDKAREVKAIEEKPIEVKYKKTSPIFNQIAESYILTNPGASVYKGDLSVFGINVQNRSLPYLSDEGRAEQIERYKKDLEELLREESSGLFRENLVWYLENQIEGERFLYNSHVVNHFTGVQVMLPDFMTNYFEIKDKEDVEEYIGLLGQFEEVFDQVIKDAQKRESLGILPPSYIIDRVLQQCYSFTSVSPADCPLYSLFVQKLKDVNSIGDGEKTNYANLVREKIENSVYPAYNKFFAYLDDVYKKADSEGAGVWSLPNGDEYYRYVLRTQTTTNLTPEEIHRIGLKEVDRITTEVHVVLKEMGEEYTQIPDCFMTASEGFYGEDALREYKRLIDQMEKKLPEMFDIFPKAKLGLKPVPQYRQQSISNYYSLPAIDQSRPGVFFVNLGYTHMKSQMPTLAYHEGIPGHHMQLTIQNENEEIPVALKMIVPTAYAEGWALYAEKLAGEYGFYNDPEVRLGYLQSELTRAVRLVVDTGLHYKKWSRSEAINYMRQYSLWNAQNEIDRYIVYPGQACSYKVGELEMLKMRQKAKDKLGSKFNIKEFHRVILENGAMPLAVLEKQVDMYIESKK